MKKVRLIALFLALAPVLHADEGMWIPSLIEKMIYSEAREMGLKLTPDEIYAVNQSSIKDAVFRFGRGCTGSIISADGLALTNHHCGYGVIQAHSTVENDYLTDGFWAMTREEELPNPGLTATFLIRIEDVTGKIKEHLNPDMTEQQRNTKIAEVSDLLTKQATEGTHYIARVASYLHGNEFFLTVYEVFRDVRLVGAPPSSIGKFGGDTDNWMWPRHAGDFALFRVYTGPDGKPADYSKDNIPLNPIHYLPVSLKGIEEDDFAFIMGFPGSTDRYLTSWGVQMAIEQINPTIVKAREKRLEIMLEDMKADPAVRIQYASKYARISNHWKYYIGQTRGLKRLNVYEQKQQIESNFTQWVNANPIAQQKYSQALPLIQQAYEDLTTLSLVRTWYNEAFFRAIEAVELASAAPIQELHKALQDRKTNAEAIKKATDQVTQRLPRFFRDYNPPTDQRQLAAMLQALHTYLPEQWRPPLLDRIYHQHNGNFNRYAARLFQTSIFTDRQRLEQFLSDPKLPQLENDPTFVLLEAFREYNEKLRTALQPVNDKLVRGNRLFVAGLREKQDYRHFYPDANGTMRFTYGQVLDYYPADAVHFSYKTTLTGIFEKEDPESWEFVVPERLRELYNNRDFGDYCDEGVMVVCFITNHDITGGNSGSPVMNGNGELIGVAFDGNWEAMSGDIAYEPELQRTISVDIRYVLFVIDRFAGARHLIDEMKLVR